MPWLFALLVALAQDGVHDVHLSILGSVHHHVHVMDTGGGEPNEMGS